MASSTSSNLPDGDDLKQRVARVEGIAHDLIERQLRTITVIFGLVSAVIVAAGVLVSVLAIYGKIEVRDATREMERKFEVLAGQALKVPLLQILYEGTRQKCDYCQGAHCRCVAEPEPSTLAPRGLQTSVPFRGSHLSLRSCRIWLTR